MEAESVIDLLTALKAPTCNMPLQKLGIPLPLLPSEEERRSEVVDIIKKLQKEVWAKYALPTVAAKERGRRVGLEYMLQTSA